MYGKTEQLSLPWCPLPRQLPMGPPWLHPYHRSQSLKMSSRPHLAHTHTHTHPSLRSGLISPVTRTQIFGCLPALAIGGTRKHYVSQHNLFAPFDSGGIEPHVTQDFYLVRHHGVYEPWRLTYVSCYTDGNGCLLFSLFSSPPSWQWSKEEVVGRN